MSNVVKQTEIACFSQKYGGLLQVNTIFYNTLIKITLLEKVLSMANAHEYLLYVY